MIMNVADEGVEYPFLHILASVLAWMSAVINPFIYAFKNRQYQQAFAKVIGIRILSTTSQIEMAMDKKTSKGFTGNTKGGCNV